MLQRSISLVTRRPLAVSSSAFKDSPGGNGNGIWFTGTTSGSSRELRAVTLSGKERLVYLGTGTLTLHDISKEGRVLISRDDYRSAMIGLAPGETKEHDLSWHDWTTPRDLSDDGKLVSSDETGEAGGETGGLYVRRTDGSPAVRLGDGETPSLSPDGKWVLARGTGALKGLIQLPTGPGDSRIISSGDVPAQWTPDGKSLLVSGSDVPARVFMIDVLAGKGKLFGTYAPADPTGLTPLSSPNYSRDLKSYVFAYSRITSDLYIVDGLK